MTQASFCPNCGAARGSGAFCGNCGASFDQAPQHQQSIGWGLENPAGFRPMVVNPLVLLVASVIGLAGGFVAWAYLGSALNLDDTAPLLYVSGVVVGPLLGFVLARWVATNLLR